MRIAPQFVQQQFVQQRISGVSQTVKKIAFLNLTQKGGAITGTECLAETL
ncbi:MAG: hypothetical protein AAF311_00055 [Pseudomonadota bacterium]